ncbi:hypothetical protein EDC96DRAFT_562176 [Choanephora cucurbitarum]|nr:hypothetical protein EDC96DRAFT_562176 [Choanephora cucurbitarum]
MIEDRRSDKEGSIEQIIPASEPSLKSNKPIERKGLHCFSLGLKIFAILAIIGIVILCALLPNYIQNKKALENESTDPTNARLSRDCLRKWLMNRGMPIFDHDRHEVFSLGSITHFDQRNTQIPLQSYSAV